MQSKKIFITVVLNIFLVLMVSVLGEYNALSERFMTLENTVNTSLDMAISNSTASEELFSSQYDRSVTSVGVGQWGSKTHNGVLMYRNGVWYQGNSYVMSMFYNTYGRFPNSIGEYTTYYNQNGSRDDIYEYLFGQVGCSSSDVHISWATRGVYYSWIPRNDRKPNSTGYSAFDNTFTSEHKAMNDLSGYYDAIGKYIKTTGIVKVKDGADYSYHLEEQEFPVLAQMGLTLDPLNSVHSTTTRNNFTSSKTRGAGDYYLTPYSLGVTYVPISIVKPMLVANIENTARFNLLSSGGADLDKANQSDGCIGTEVYDNLSMSEDHVGGLHDQIVNDGQIEYDLSTVDVKVDYLMVDFYDPANKEIVANIIGAKAGYDVHSGVALGSSPDQLLEETVEDLKESDTYGLSMGLTGERLVARVTTRLKVHIPYVNPIFQWLCFKDNQAAGGTNHFDIKLFDNDTGKVSIEDDGVWYQTTSYMAIAR